MDFGRKDVIAAKELVYRLGYATPLVEETPLSERAGGRVAPARSLFVRLPALDAGAIFVRCHQIDQSRARVPVCRRES